MPDTFTFVDALLKLKVFNESVARRGWNGKNMWITIQWPDGGSKMTRPYIYMRTATGDLIPWLASQADLLADDWFVVPARV